MSAGIAAILPWLFKPKKDNKYEIKEPDLRYGISYINREKRLVVFFWMEELERLQNSIFVNEKQIKIDGIIFTEDYRFATESSTGLTREI